MVSAGPFSHGAGTLDVFAITVLASDGDHVLATRFFHGEYAISHGSESISLHNVLAVCQLSILN